MVIPQVDTPSHLQIRRGVRLRFGLSCPPSISQPSEPVARLHIRILPILPSRFSPYPRDMGGTPWPQAVNPTARPSTVGPRTAVFTQNRPREEGIAIFDKIICRLLLRRDGRDTLVGHFAQDLGHESHLRFGCAQGQKSDGPY